MRWFVVLVFALALVAAHLGLDLLLGGFAAGLITRQVLQTREIPTFDSRLTAVAFGVFIPFFFVVSGMKLDIDALFGSPSGVAKLVLFFVLFLVVRGTPALLLYRGVLPLREDRMALALFTATQLPLVVAITTVAVEGGHMRSSTAAALVGAGALSTLAGPLHGLRMRRIAAERRAADDAAPCIRTSRSRLEASPGAPRGPRGRPALPAEDLAQLGDVAPGPGGQRPGRGAGPRPADPRPAPPRPREPPIALTAVQAIFGALAGGMITFTGIVFSAVFVAAQIQTSSYSPRLAARLRRDPVVIAGLALPTATATYSLFALAAIGRQTNTVGRDFVPAATVIFGLALALVTLGAFVALVQRAFESTQIGGILRTLMRRGFAVIEDVHPRDGPLDDVRGAAARARRRDRAHAPRAAGRHRGGRPCRAAAPRRPDRGLRRGRSRGGRVPRRRRGRPARQRRPHGPRSGAGRGASSCSPASAPSTRTRPSP